MSQNETHFDVAIVGAGFSGTMVAVHLFKEVSEILSYVRSPRRNDTNRPACRIYRRLTIGQPFQGAAAICPLE